MQPIESNPRSLVLIGRAKVLLAVVASLALIGCGGTAAAKPDSLEKGVSNVGVTSADPTVATSPTHVVEATTAPSTKPPTVKPTPKPTTTPKPKTTTTPKPKPKTSSPTKPPTKKPTTAPTQQGITPGAFCKPRDAYGIGKSNGRLYRCEPKTPGAQARWLPV